MAEPAEGFARTGASTAADCLAGGGNMGALMRAFDWSQTPLGPVEQWPQSLRTAVSIILASGFPMLIVWGDDFIQLYNDAYRPVLGATKHPAALGQRSRECWHEIWDDVLNPMFSRVMAGGEPIWSEDLLFVLDRNGYVEETYFTFSYSAIRDESGRPGGVLVTCVETTERVVGERRLRTLRELAAHASTSQKVDEACRAAAATMAANAADLPFTLLYLRDNGVLRLCGTSGFADLAAPGFDLSVCEAVVASGEVQVVSDARSRFPDLPNGPWPEPARAAIVLPIAASGQAPADGALVAGISSRRALDADYRTFFELVAGQIATAIHAARTYEAERERAEALAQIDRAKTAFFSNISHEFRTPLTLMLGPTEDALSSPSGALTGPDLETVYRNQKRLLELVNTLLDFSRIESGRVEARYEPTDLATLTGDLASAFRSAIERGGIRFEVDCQPLGEPVYVDRQMWENIVLNLLSNAFKFTFDGTIRVALARAGDERIELTVSDTGVGIPEVELPRIFERFHRVEGTRGRTREGSGIGLALVHDLVQLHGGDVSVTSRMGAGTTFTVALRTGTAHLPADRVSAQPSAIRRPTASAAFVDAAMRWLPPAPDAASHDDGGVQRIAAGRSATVLVVDDNADMRDYLVRLLSAHWQVEAASDAAGALAIARSRPPDLVLTDVMMPGGDGFALIRALRAEKAMAGLPIVVLSARAGDEARLDGLQQGANDYIVKPFSARELVIRINSQLVLAEHARERQALLMREQLARQEAALQKANLELLFTQFPAPMCILRGPDLVIELANPTMCQAWGRRHADVIGRPIFDALPELRDQVFRDLLRGVVRTGVAHIGQEAQVQLARGAGGALETAYFNFVYAPFRNVRGETEGVLVVAMEVTDQVVARRQVDDLRAQAESANRAKDEFLAVLGHELRNPLAPILTALRLMELRGGGQLAKERTIIERQANHLVRLVDDLLDVSRIARRMITLKKERADVSDLVARAIETAAPLIEQREHQLVVNVPGGLAIEADPERFAQIISNLLTNAAKYTDRHGQITVAARRDGADIWISVKDTGVGIEPEMLPRVFEMFTQERQSLDRSHGGLGLGLTIVRSLTHLHGGRVTVHSAGRGRGTEFVVRVPAAAEPAAASAASTRAATSTAGVARRILIVDDNEDLAATLGELLRTAGHAVRVAHDGPSALQLAAEFVPDVALIDIGLPVMDGYEIGRRLRAQEALRNARLVALTGYGQAADQQRSADAGFDVHLVKPIDPGRLNDIVMEEVPHDQSAA